MVFRILMISVSLLLAACASTPYNEDWSKAKNLSYAAGLKHKLYDQQLSASAYSKKGKLFDYKLNHVTHPAYGSSSGVTGVSVQPYGPFDNFYWGWTIPGASHLNEHRFFAWMPSEMADSTASAQYVMETLLTRSSLAVLKEMGFRHKPEITKFKHEGIVFQQWYLGEEGGNCSLSKMNCVLTLHIPPPSGKKEAPSFSFYSIASESTWFFSAADAKKYPRLILAEGDGKRSISGSVFYQKLSSRLPGWIYFYLAPNKVGTGENNQIIPYPYVLEKGRPLLFIRPVK